VNTLKFSYDKMIDYRGGYSAVLTDGKSTEGKGKVTNVFAGSLSETPMYYYKKMSDAENYPYLWFTFEVSSFVSREITIRNKYLSEMWTEIGGAWASALLITSFFFLEKVGGITGKIKVFRFNTSSAKQALMDAAAKEFGEMLQVQVGEELHGIASGIVGEANIEEAKEAAEKVKQAQESVVPTLAALQSATKDLENAAEGIAEEITDDPIKKMLDELWAVEREKLLIKLITMQARLQEPVAAGPE